MKKFLVIALLFFSCQRLQAQLHSLVDSLQRTLRESKDEQSRFQANSALFEAYIWSYPDTALLYAQQCFFIARNSHSDKALAKVYGQLQQHSALAGNYPLALHYAFESMKTAERARSFLLIAEAYQRLTHLYIDQGDYLRAIFYARKAKGIWDAYYTPPRNRPSKHNDTLAGYGSSIASLARASLEAGLLDSALFYLKQVDFYNSWRTGMEWYIFPFIKGRIAEKRGNYTTAIQYYNEALHSARYYQFHKDVMDISSAISNTYKNLQQWDSSIQYANIVLEASKAAKYPVVQMQALNLLATSYKAKNNIDSTAKYFALTLAAKDSLFNQDKVAQLQSLAFNEQVRLQELQEEDQKKMYSYRLYALIAGIGVLGIVTFLLYRNNRHKQLAKLRVEKAYEELKATQSQLVQREKMASLGELTAGIAHEIQNPLNFVTNFSEVNTELLQELEEEAANGNLEEIKHLTADLKENEQKIALHGRRAEAIVKNMLQHSRTTTGERQATNLHALADEYLRLAYHGFRAKDKSFNVKIETHFDQTIEKVNLVPQEMGRVLLNLLTNAFYAVHEKLKKFDGSYEPTVSVSTKRRADKIEVSIKDNGMGISKSLQEKIFQPFFTTKPTGQGTGLGLSLSYDIVKAHGGELMVESEEGTGSQFTIQIPAI